MAVFGVLGDIHGNREALLAVLETLERRGVRKLLCVGDVIGYNADPDACVALMRDKDAVSIAGNHDLIGIGSLGFERCSNKARYSLRRTRQRLAPQSAEWLRALPERRVIDGAIALVHGGVRDVQLYMRAPGHIRDNAALLREDFPSARVCFFGHSHEQRAYAVRGDAVQELAEETISLDRGLIHFINPGSVDAQRKRRHKLAECALFDSDAWTLEFVRVPYDAASTEKKAVRAGYRIGLLTDWAWSTRNRFLARLRPG